LINYYGSFFLISRDASAAPAISAKFDLAPEILVWWKLQVQREHWLGGLLSWLLCAIVISRAVNLSELW